MNDAMLPSQRALFDIPREVCFFNAATCSPLPRCRRPAAPPSPARASRGSCRPTCQPQQYERARSAAAALIGADSDDVALISSVGYGVATAGKVLTIPRGSRVLVLQDDHTSPVLEWMSRAEAAVSRSRRCAAGRRRLDLGGARRHRTARRRAAGAGLDLVGPLVGRRRARHGAHRATARRQGAALLVDATHDVGVAAST